MKYKAVIFDLFETLVTEWGIRNIQKRGCIDGMPAADKPMDIIKFI